MLSSHCSHLEAANCNPTTQVWCTIQKSSVNPGQSVHFSSEAHVPFEPRHQDSKHYIPPAHTCKLLTGSPTQVWSVCALWAPLFRCDRAFNPKTALRLATQRSPTSVFLKLRLCACSTSSFDLQLLNQPPFVRLSADSLLGPERRKHTTFFASHAC